MRGFLACFWALVLLVSQIVGGAVAAEQSSSSNLLEDADVAAAPITAYKRFYRWVDTKRGEDDVDAMRAKRKQFYAWAGKRSAPNMAEDYNMSNNMEVQKRKQFYAWAGK
ncbi:unnamed protein product [Caenorhabditis angaria]|uniref:RxLR effector protein n=1 Tax=Caenorhabditis angaria TaxID=860376 RepID=A0A9P1IEY0_9PELO|nr:unnamed protein product [Caenorhabditis angaria]